jgi:hypothetical protein
MFLPRQFRLTFNQELSGKNSSRLNASSSNDRGSLEKVSETLLCFKSEDHKLELAMLVEGRKF